MQERKESWGMVNTMNKINELKEESPRLSDDPEMKKIQMTNINKALMKGRTESLQAFHDIITDMDKMIIKKVSDMGCIIDAGE